MLGRPKLLEVMSLGAGEYYDWKNEMIEGGREGTSSSQKGLGNNELG
jgi:hypothetical protein